MGHFPPRNFKILHCRNFQRIKMKFYIVIMKILYSNAENFQKCSVCRLLDLVSCLSSEEKRLHRLSKRQQYVACCYRTSGAMVVARRLCLVTERAYYVHIVLALRMPGDTVGHCGPTAVRGPHVARHSVFSGPPKHSGKT